MIRRLALAGAGETADFVAANGIDSIGGETLNVEPVEDQLGLRRLLIIDANAVLPAAPSLQGLQSIARRHRQLAKFPLPVQLRQFPCDDCPQQVAQSALVVLTPLSLRAIPAWRTLYRHFPAAYRDHAIPRETPQPTTTQPLRQ